MCKMRDILAKYDNMFKMIEIRDEFVHFFNISKIRDASNLFVC